MTHPYNVTIRHRTVILLFNVEQTLIKIQTIMNLQTRLKTGTKLSWKSSNLSIEREKKFKNTSKIKQNEISFLFSVHHALRIRRSFDKKVSIYTKTTILFEKILYCSFCVDWKFEIRTHWKKAFERSNKIQNKTKLMTLKIFTVYNK